MCAPVPKRLHMPKFWKYIKHNPYYDPERTAPASARPYRTRRELLLDLATREPRMLDIPNYRAVLGGLSRVDKKAVNQSKKLNVKGREARPKVDLRATAITQLAKYHRLNADEFAKLTPQQKVQYRRLRSAASSQKLSPPGVDKRQYNPTGKDFASTIHGYRATFRPLDSWLPAFANPAQVIPCIQRKMRREVMFANDRAGRGYKAKKRRTWSSGVPC